MENAKDKNQRVSILAVVAISLSIIIAMLDSTIANVALPVIAKDFSVTESASILIVNAYQFAVVASLLPLAALGKSVGNKRIFIFGVILFAFSSMGCALSETLNTLTLFRIIQGFGAAAILSVNAALIKDVYPSRLLARGLGINVMIVSVSAAAGPSIASTILSMASWNWLFTINVPIACLSLVLSIFSLNNKKDESVKFDSSGALFIFAFFISFSTMVLGVTKNNIWLLLPFLFITLLLFVTLCFDQKRKQDAALIPVAIFRNKTLSLSLLMSLLSYSTQLLAYVSLPFYFHNVLNKNLVEIGLLLTAWPLATMVTSIVAADLVKKFNPNIIAMTGLLFLLVGMILMTVLPSEPTNIEIIWRVAVCGIGFGLFQSPNNYLIMTSTTSNNSSIASGLLGSSRLVGQIIGSALVAVFFNINKDLATNLSLISGAGFSLFSLIVSYARHKNNQNN
ncbi:MFS transporter [Yokenella regensburgei]|uniref:MFS transporter n=1 Tax=Yokenella regensburgei TaxID=158877 RepID=UPI003ED94BAD